MSNEDKKDKREPSEKEVVSASKMMMAIPPDVLVIALLMAMDKLLFSGGAKSHKDQMACVAAAMELCKKVVREARKAQEEDDSKERAGEIAESAISRAIKSAKEAVAKKDGDRPTSPFDARMAPGSDTVN